MPRLEPMVSPLHTICSILSWLANYQSAFLFTLIDILDTKQNKLFGFSFKGQWFDTGTIQRLENAEKLWSGG